MVFNLYISELLTDKNSKYVPIPLPQKISIHQKEYLTTFYDLLYVKISTPFLWLSKN